jgi:protocatechuate 3,4-dioxygenase, beta subunit
MTALITLSRRRALAAGASLAALALANPAAAARLAATPAQTEGPFYPLSLPLDRDNDLVKVAGQPTLAKGVVTHVYGRVLDLNGRPIAGARVEIWQCDADGHYHHPGDRRGPADPAFQGFGQTLTVADGAYRFRTIRPVAYPGRTPHIHFKVAAPNTPALTTQMYVAGEPGNARDGVLNGIRDPQARARVIVALEPAVSSEAGALQGRFDIVLAEDA